MSEFYRLYRTYYEKYVTLFWAAYAVTFIVYIYLFTTVILTNHTFPNSWIYPYPSFKTTSEGRWFADLVIYLFGGSGVQSFQMFVAVALQVVNGIIFAELLSVKSRVQIFLFMILLSLYPAFLDYYSFSVDHITFALGDTLALSGFLALARIKRRWVALIASMVPFVLCLASYQPKIALLAILLLVHALLLVMHPPEGIGIKGVLRRIGLACFALAISICVYYASIKITCNFDLGIRTQQNSIVESMRQLLASYRQFIYYFYSRSDYLPSLLRFLPLGAIALGIIGVYMRCRHRGMAAVLIATILLGLMPIALRSSYIINSVTWQYSGRINFPGAYVLVFFLAVAALITRFRLPVLLTTGVFVYFSLIVATQESNHAYFKTIFDLGKLNRIVSRIETVVPDLYARSRPVVVIGHLRMENQRFKRFTNAGNYSQFNTESFQVYRQVEILNFLLGRDVFVYPTNEQRDAAFASAQSKQPWPADESVSLENGVVTVLLEEAKTGVPVTWTEH